MTFSFAICLCGFDAFAGWRFLVVCVTACVLCRCRLWFAPGFHLLLISSAGASNAATLMYFQCRNILCVLIDLYADTRE